VFAVSTSPFFGRQGDLESLRTLLVSDRLVTITGAGGIGKTRLAVEFARAAAQGYPSGVWLVELANLENPGLVVSTIAESVGARNDRAGTSLERLVRRLSAGQQLLLLDNCEHVADDVATAAQHLLAQCPDLVLLATSRQPLGVDGERVFRIDPLTVPEGGASEMSVVANAAAVQLFCDRAVRLAPQARLSTENAADIATICRRLEGIPLALELAASWTPVLSIRQMLRQIDDSLSLLRRNTDVAPSRHRTMQVAMDWSYTLLTPLERDAFVRLSVFVGGFTLDAADAVLQGLYFEDASPLQVISSLVARSLVTANISLPEARYRLLEPVRQYAAGRLHLRTDEETAARRRQLEYLTMLAEAADLPTLGGPDEPWLSKVDAELDNIRAALSWGFKREGDTAARLATSLRWYCWIRSLFEEGYEWGRQATAAQGRVQARARHMRGALASQRGDLDEADRELGRAVELMRAGGWLNDLAMALYVQGHVAYIRGDLGLMASIGDEACELAREQNDDALLMHALWLPGACASAGGDHLRAADLLNQALVIARRRHAGWYVWVLVCNLADVAVDMGDATTALHTISDDLQPSSFWDGRREDSLVSYLVDDVGMLAIQGGHFETGLRLMGAAQATRNRTGYRETPDEAARRNQWREIAAAQLDHATADAVWNRGLGFSFQESLADVRFALTELPISEESTSVGVDRPRYSVRTSRHSSGTSGRLLANSFLREGDFWSLTYESAVVRVKDTKGVRDIARLLATPGRGVAAVDLLSSDRQRASKSMLSIDARGLTMEGDAGEALDAAARTQYRARVLDLEEEITQAEADNDPERVSAAREEREFLLAELRAAVGLGGRARRVLDPAERARKAVTGRIRDAISHIEAAHPQLGRHLRLSVRTGSFCVYDPPEATFWRP
jgi:predicted ATPase